MSGLIGTTIDNPGSRPRNFFEQSVSISEKSEEDYLEDQSQDQDSILDSESGEGEKLDDGEEC